MHTTIKCSVCTPSFKNCLYSGNMPGVHLEDITVYVKTYMLITPG